jgi:hypothetical protein
MTKASPSTRKAVPGLSPSAHEFNNGEPACLNHTIAREARSLENLVAKGLGPQGFDPPGRPGFDESFPDRSAVRAAHRRGVRLWRLSYALRLLAALFGLSRT